MRSTLLTRLTASIWFLSACASSRVVVTHLGSGQGTVVSKTCDNNTCVEDGFINCPPPAAPPAPSDTLTAAVDRPGCFADVERQHRLDVVPVTGDQFTGFGGPDNFCTDVPNYCVVEQRIAGEVFVGFARPPFPAGQRADLNVEVIGAGTVTNNRQTSAGCGPSCGGYPLGRIVTLTATRPSGGGTVTWTGCNVVRDAGAASRCTVLMNATKNIRVKFDAPGAPPPPAGTAPGSVALCAACSKDADCAGGTGNPGGTLCRNGRCEEDCNKPRIPLCFIDADCKCKQDTPEGRHACPALDPPGTPGSRSVALCGECRGNNDCVAGAVCHNGKCEEDCNKVRIPACFVDAACKCMQDAAGGRRGCP